ncbi:hypothetical protein O3P69_018518 [Scylla paramamosain]|uniref:Uncharacterized protein n=1 Tax=Scylla paramamosain TaxID=85552 RepID=A0AAW0T1X9_SCYPA
MCPVTRTPHSTPLSPSHSHPGPRIHSYPPLNLSPTHPNPLLSHHRSLRFPTRPSQPPPHHGVRNATMTSPGSVENFHQHFRQQQHQHHQQQHQQQHQHQPVRFPSGKCIGSDDVTRPKVHTTTNGQASPPSKGLPT